MIKDAKSAKAAKKVETIRERAERLANEKTHPVAPIEAAKPAKKRRLIFFKVKPGKVKKVRRFHIIPRFFGESWRELKDVTWPDRKITSKLTVAVILFSVVFGTAVGLVDWGLGVVFKRVVLK
ncbi:MAG TPA: preprotein translocase subunit SecE [Candidatus Saccharimonadales bacterium]|nr:preprotein translocase subunit SecE [Candidatus Saccharimonadales bacterium]